MCEAGGAATRQTVAVDRHRYVFSSVWSLPVPAVRVFAALSRLDEYPAWWPQVRHARRIDDETCGLAVRSALPYTLRIVAHHARRDPAAGVLEARLSGDLVGHSRWTVLATPAGVRCRFEEDVHLARPILRRLGFARPAFRANHALMMRAGERGLRTQLGSPG